MNSIIENAKRQSLTKRSDVGIFKRIVPTLVAALCCLLVAAEASATDITSDMTLTVDTTIENISGGGNGIRQFGINTNGKTLTLYNTENSYFGGKITGSGNVVKTGSGTIYFQYQPSGIGTVYPAEFSHSGTTTVSEGTLNLCSTAAAIWQSQVIIDKNGVIETSFDQTFNNLSGTGTIKVNSSPELDSIELDLLNSADSEFSGSIVGDTSLRVGRAWFGGSGTVTLSGSLNDVNDIIVYNYGQLKLTGAALDYYGPMTVNGGKSVEYEVESGSKRYNITEDNKIDVRTTSTDTGKLIKSGDGTLQICCEAKDAVRADSVFISSGRIDYQGYFKSDASFGSPSAPKDCFVVEEGAVFSPGIGVGDVILNGGNFTIRDSAIALFEFGAYNEDPTLQNFDTITIKGEFCKTVVNSNSIIQLAFLNNDAEKWAKEGAEYHIITEGFTFNPNDGDFSYVLGNYQDYFKLVAREDQGFYLIGLGAPEPEPVVPEPSTWALLILGVAGLLCLKKLRKK